MRLWEIITTAHSSMPAQGESNSLLRLNWTISGRTKSDEVIELNSGSSQQHARTGGVRFKFSPTRVNSTIIRFGLNQGRSSDSPQQHARTGGGVKLSVTCDLDYLRFGPGYIGLNSDSSQQHARTGGVRFQFSPMCELSYQVRTKSGKVFGQHTAACPHRVSQILSYTSELDYLRFGLSQVRL